MIARCNISIDVGATLAVARGGGDDSALRHIAISAGDRKGRPYDSLIAMWRNAVARAS